MVDDLLHTAGHSSDPAVRQKMIERAAQILGARGAETWPPAFERLRHRLHLAPGILEHSMVTESMDRDRNRVAYAQARINEIAQRGQIRAPEQRRNSPPRAAETASTSPTLPTRAEHTNRASPEDQDRGAPAR
jgi:hypothetical protein